jgi:DNA-binding IclR family transcriptional regulator
LVVYASAPEEAMLGINAVAPPIFDDDDTCVAALAIVGSIQFLPGKPKPEDIANRMLWNVRFARHERPLNGQYD